MKLSKKSIVYLSEALDTISISGPNIEKICHKIEVEPEYSYDEKKGASIANRLWALVENLNGTDKLNALVKVIITEYNGRTNLEKINNSLMMSGYKTNHKGEIISQMVEETNIQEKISEIDQGLKNLGLDHIAKDFQSGVENYGRGKNFPDIRRALEGLVKEIVDIKVGNYTGNMKIDLRSLSAPGILKTSSKKFVINRENMEIEHAHAYSIWKVLSNYITHTNKDAGEIERDFAFFQSVGLIWLLVKRYEDNP